MLILAPTDKFLSLDKPKQLVSSININVSQFLFRLKMELSCTLLFLVFVLTTIYTYLTWNYDFWKKQGVASAPGAIPGLGHATSMLLLRENLAEFCERFHKYTRGASMLGFYFMRTPALLIRDPELIKSVLVTNFANFQHNMDRIDSHLDPLLKKTPFFSAGQVWKASRAQFVKSFTGKRLRLLFSIVQQVCFKCKNHTDKKIREGGGVFETELRDFFLKFTGEVAANAGLGIEGKSFEDCPDPRSFTVVSKEVFEPTPIGGFKGMLRLLLPKLANVLRVRFMSTNADNFFRSTVRSVVEHRSEEGVAVHDFLQFTVEGMENPTEEMIAAQITAFFFDIYDTSAAVLHFAAHQLAVHPEVQEKARCEAESVFEKYGGELSYESLKELTYLEQVVYETIRMNPPLGDLVKVCTKEVDIKGSNGQSCRVLPGTMIFTSVRGIHMDEEFWNDPQTFDPERFGADKKGDIRKFTFLPFGEGPRICVGMRMGMMQVKAILATILRYYALEPSTKTPFPISMNQNTNVVVVKGGLWARFRLLNEEST